MTGLVGVLGEQDVAAALVELASQGVEQADRTVGLHGVAALLQPRPRVVARWPLGGEQPCRLADLIGGHPGEGLRSLRGVAGRELAEQFQGGPAAERLSAGAGEAVGPGQRGLDCGPVVPAAGAVGRRSRRRGDPRRRSCAGPRPRRGPARPATGRYPPGPGTGRWSSHGRSPRRRGPPRAARGSCPGPARRRHPAGPAATGRPCRPAPSCADR